MLDNNINKEEQFDLYETVCYEFMLYEVKCRDFYRDVFPLGSFENVGEFVDGKYNGILVSINKDTNKPKRYTVTDDLKAITVLNETDNFNVIAPISYAGKSRKSENARYLYALAIDLDGVDSQKRLDFLFRQFKFEIGTYMSMPKPTYCVASGTGLHLYYLLEQPVPLYKNNVKELEKLKRQLTWMCWTQGASSLHENVQYESLFQAFRAVGSITKTGTRVKAFKVGEKTTIDYLNQCVPEKHQAKNITTYSSKMSLCEAKEKYPNWYEKRIIKGEIRGSWTNSKALYDWWLKRVGEVTLGHRYWFLMTLATYAIKCDVSFIQLKDDALHVQEIFNRDYDEEFTDSDVKAALTAYSESYHHYPIKTIVNRTGLPIEKNKRNGRKQEQHLQLARGIRALKGQMGENVVGGGRPDKQLIVKDWKTSHPHGKPKNCINETGISKNTVYKWWSS